MAQVIPGCILGMALDILILINRKQEESVVCILTTPMQGRLSDIYTKLVIVVSILIILCYGSFIFFLKKLRMSSEKVKSIYRSLFLISLSVVLGYFSTMIVLSINGLLNLKINIIYLSLFAGLFASLATAVNFFIYYGISKEYRKVFDEVLGIGRLKRKFYNKDESKSFGAQKVTCTSVRSLAGIALTHVS